MSRRYKQLEDNRLEHRVIMEDALGFKLPKEFVVHHITGFFESNINKCCNGKIESYKGYVWRYAETVNVARAIGERLKEVEEHDE